MTTPPYEPDPEAVAALLQAVRRLPAEHQISLAIALTELAQDQASPRSQLSSSLAGAGEDLKEAYAAAERLKRYFGQLVQDWKELRPKGADVAAMTRHRAYQKIIGLGKIAVPWILEEMAERPDHWFVALHELTGASPVPEASRGRLPEMTAAWLDWGRQQGHIR